MKAFELRSAVKDTFAGGSFALADGKTFDIAKALKKGKGRIVTSDPVVIDRLERVEALKASKLTATEKKAAGVDTPDSEAGSNGGEG